MAAVSSKQFTSHQREHNGLSVNGADMLGCDPANTYATRPIAVLEGDAAWDFLERVEANLKNPLQTRPSKEEREEWKKFFKEQKLRELYERSEG